MIIKRTKKLNNELQLRGRGFKFYFTKGKCCRDQYYSNGIEFEQQRFNFFVWHTCPGAISLNVSGAERMGNLNLVHIRQKTMDVLEERQGKWGPCWLWIIHGSARFTYGCENGFAFAEKLVHGKTDFRLASWILLRSTYNRNFGSQVKQVTTTNFVNIRLTTKKCHQNYNKRHVNSVSVSISATRQSHPPRLFRIG